MSVLTHYIDGHIIYESDRPLDITIPVERKPKKPAKQAKPEIQNDDTPDLKDMNTWDSKKVAQFIDSHVPNLSEIFLQNEIDGNALALLINKNLNLETLKAMQIKIGPAIKLIDFLGKYKTT